MSTRDEFIVEVWDLIEKDVVGASALVLIQDAVVERFGNEAIPSPAMIARVLADAGSKLGHPQILETDSRWREERQFFNAEELAFDTLDAALAFIDKLQQSDPTDERLRLSIQQVKMELEVVAASQKISQKRRELAREVAQWLTIWLQNPKIFPEWLTLRRSTPEFQQLFGTFARP
jgi:hypothetical protein